MSPKIYNLKKEERQVIWRNHFNAGDTPEQCDERVDGVVEHMKNFVAELKTKNKTPAQIDKRFKEEFYKICERLDK